MQRFDSFWIACCIIGISLVGFLFPRQACADGLSLLTNWEYRISNRETTDKIENMTTKSQYERFDQIYRLDLDKVLSPTLSFRTGGSFEDNKTVVDGHSNSRIKNLRPYANILFETSVLEGTALYQKNERKSIRERETDKDFIENTNFYLNWEPVDLPAVRLELSRSKIYDEPWTRELNSDVLGLKSNYQYGDFRFDYSHYTVDSDQKRRVGTDVANTTQSESQNNEDEASIRFQRKLNENVSTSSRLYFRRQSSKFSGSAERLVPTPAPGIVIGNNEDLTPVTSNPEPGFTLSSVDLLVDSPVDARQLSFGLDFRAQTKIDRLFVNLTGDNATREVDSGDFHWALYVRDDETENWTMINLTQVQTGTTDTGEDRFEFSFPPLETRFIKLVTTPLAPPDVAPGLDLLIDSLEGKRLLPADTSKFSTNTWSVDSSLNWRWTERTRVSSNLYYLQEESKPFAEKKAVLSLSGNLSHIFNRIFVGRLSATHSQVDEQDRGLRHGQNLSASLTANYTDTFDQSFIYTFSRSQDEENLVDYTNSFYLRSNFRMYPGWSLFIANGYSRTDAEASNSRSRFYLTVDNSVRPNKWVNMGLFYAATWENEGDDSKWFYSQNGRFSVNVIPFNSLRIGASLYFSIDEQEENKSYWEQTYSINWLLLRDGSVYFSVGYAQRSNDDGEDRWSLSPSLRWKLNQKCTLSLDYTMGEASDETRVSEYNNTALMLSILY
jgi:hypothetical protein